MLVQGKELLSFARSCRWDYRMLLLSGGGNKWTLWGRSGETKGGRLYLKVRIGGCQGVLGESKSPNQRVRDGEPLLGFSQNLEYVST